MIIETIDIQGSTHDTILNSEPKLYGQFDCVIDPHPSGSWIDKAQLHFVKSSGLYKIQASCTDPYEKDKFQYEISPADDNPSYDMPIKHALWNFKVLRLWFHLKAESLSAI